MRGEVGRAKVVGHVSQCARTPRRAPVFRSRGTVWVYEDLNRRCAALLVSRAVLPLGVALVQNCKTGYANLLGLWVGAPSARKFVSSDLASGRDPQTFRRGPLQPSSQGLL